MDLDSEIVSQFPVLAGTYYLSFSTGSDSPPYFNAYVKLTILTPPPPVITSILNAASLSGGPVAPSEIITVLGSHTTALYNASAPAPEPPANQILRFPAAAAGTSVTFNGIPGRILYAVGDQINVAVPASLNGQQFADVIVQRYTQYSQPFRVALGGSAPGIFSLDQTGTGQGVVLNADYSVSDMTHPAPSGSAVQIFGTGGGLLDTQFLDGQILYIGPPFPRFLYPVSVTIGGKDSVVLYAGPAPYLVYGVFQVNVIVPNLPPGRYPVVVSFGGSKSRSDISMYLR